MSARLKDLRSSMLRLHKILLEMERSNYEQARGRVSSGELLQLVINHEQFAWLRSISELIVQIDEMLDADEPTSAEEASSVLTQVSTLLKPSDEGSSFAQKYYAALQREPSAVLAHREVMKILNQRHSED